MTEKIVDGTVYLIFLKGQRDRPDNKYVGVTTKSLEERMRKHKKSQTIKSRGQNNTMLCKAMREKGIENWDITPLAELWLSTKSELLNLEKYYIRLLKPDLNLRNGSLSDEECKTKRKWSAKPWKCPTCLTVTRISHKWQHRQSKYHKAIDNLMFELD